MEKLELLVPPEAEPIRLDRWLTDYGLGPSRAHVRRLIDGGNVRVDGRLARASYKVQPGQKVDVEIPPAEEGVAQPEPIPLNVVYEDDDVLVINKVQGMVVHPAVGHKDGTLVNALLARAGTLSTVSGEDRPGIVHRLDKDTSGLMVVAKNDRAHLSLAGQIRAREADREYKLVVHGRVRSDKTRVNAPIGRHPVQRRRMTVLPDGRPSETAFEVLERFDEYTFMKAVLTTGRTHQIRVHTAHLGHPIIGDKVYGPKRYRWNLDGQCLHAYRLAFAHPTTDEWVSFEAPLPEHFEKVLRDLRARKKSSERA